MFEKTAGEGMEEVKPEMVEKSGVKIMKELVSMEEVKSFTEETGLQFLYVLTTS